MVFLNIFSFQNASGTGHKLKFEETTTSTKLNWEIPMKVTIGVCLLNIQHTTKKGLSVKGKTFHNIEITNS